MLNPNISSELTDEDVAAIIAAANTIKTKIPSIANLKEAVELHFEDESVSDYQQFDEVLIGEGLVHG